MEKSSANYRSYKKRKRGTIKNPFPAQCKSELGIKRSEK